MMEWLLIISTALYLAQLIFVQIGWKRMPVLQSVDANKRHKISFSVIIPFRNESRNLTLLFSHLLKLNHRGQFEVIWVNDHSEDESAEILAALIATLPNHKLFSLDQFSGKKAGLAYGIAKATGDYIVTTDADVQMPAAWLSAIARAVSQSNSDMLILPVSMIPDASFHAGFQMAENIAIQGLSLGYAGWNRPISCNGANLVFRKSVFNEVAGYFGHEEVLSGDDVLLLQRFLNQGKKVAACWDPELIVQTPTEPNLRMAIDQRLRWSGKSSHMTHRWARTSGGILMLHSVLIWIALLTATVSAPFWLSITAIRAIADVLLIKYVEKHYNLQLNPLKLALISIIYILYLPLIFVGSIFIKPLWKGRKT